LFARLVAGLFLVLIAQGTFADELRENEAIVGGGSSEADGLWVSGPSVYLRKNSPGLVVGMMRVPGKERSISYALIIKGEKSRSELARYDSQCGVSGSTANSKGFLEIANKKVAFEHTLKLDSQGKKPSQEVLSINGTEIEVGKGRVVLVDMSVEKVTWKQVRIDLPQSPHWPSKTAQVESQSKKMLEKFRENQEVVTF